MPRNIVRYGSQSILIIVMMLGILFFVNIISSRFFTRADFTENKEFTITDSTKTILKGLDDIVNIRLYFSSDLPPYLANVETQINDVLDEYKAYSNNRIAVEFVDPSKDPAIKEKAQRLGIPELQLTVIEKDQRQVRKAFLGISVQYGDKNQVIPVIKNLNNLEYDLTSAIFKVTDSKQRMLGWVGAKGDETSPISYSEIGKTIEQEYTTRFFEPGKVASIPETIGALIVDGNQILSDRAKYAIDQYLMKGGKVIFLTDGIQIDHETMTATVASQNIHEMLTTYGIGIQPALIVDRSNAYASFNSGFMRFSLPYPFWPKILPEGFNKEFPAVNQLESIVLPWTSPLTVIATPSESFKVTDIAQTSRYSASITENFDLNPQQKFDINPDEFKQQSVALQVDGTFQSVFTNQPIPEDPQAAKDQSKPKEPESALTTSKPTTIAILASTRFITNQFIQMFEDNRVFFQNLVDSYLIGDQLIGIRSRAVTDRPLSFGQPGEKIEESAQEKIKSVHRFAGTYGMSILLIAFGIIRLTIRKNHKRTMIEKNTGR